MDKLHSKKVLSLYPVCKGMKGRGRCETWFLTLREEHREGF